LRWRNAGSAEFTWGDCWAVISTLPWDAPLSRTDPDWQWGDPRYDLLVTMLETVHNQLLALRCGLAGKNASQADLLRIPRPGDKSVTRFGNNPVSLDELDAWLESRIAG